MHASHSFFLVYRIRPTRDRYRYSIEQRKDFCIWEVDFHAVLDGTSEMYRITEILPFEPGAEMIKVKAESIPCWHGTDISLSSDEDHRNNEWILYENCEIPL